MRGKLTEDLVLILKLGPDLQCKAHRTFHVSFKIEPQNSIHTQDEFDTIVAPVFESVSGSSL